MTWPLCSPPRRVAAGVERLEHVAVADRRLDDVDAGRLHRQAEPEVGHHRDDDGVVAQRRRARAGRSAQMAMRWSPSTSATGVIDGHQAVGVAVEGQPEVGAVGDDRGRQRRRCRWPRSRR